MESVVTYVPLPKVTAPGAVIVMESREVLKVFKDPLFGEFKVYKTKLGRPSFWEEDVSKIQRLIDAFKVGHNLKNACIYAGVQRMAYYRFIEEYPSFRDVKEACETQTTFRAMNSVQEAMPTKPELAFKYMEKRGDFNFDTQKVDDEKPLQPSINVGVQVNNQVNNEGRIEERATTRFVTRVSERSGTVQEARDHSMAEGVQG